MLDGRDGMALQGSASYYFNRGGIGVSGGSGIGNNVHAGGGSATSQAGGLLVPPDFKAFSSPHVTVQSKMGMSGGAACGSTWNVPGQSLDFAHGMSTPIARSVSQGGETVKKKRGRPRKYGPDGAKMTLGLSPLSASTPSSGAITPAKQTRRGRPPGSGWKQQLAPLGEWMNSSAGLAFTPHVLHFGVGEDVAAKILAFAQQRPRALCILSGSGSVSSVTLRQPTTSDCTVTYEGRLEILCLSGSYLLAESGGHHNRTGGISISVCSPDGHMIGGAIGGRLMAAAPVQVVACSFVYGGTKATNKAESGPTEERYLIEQSTEKRATPVSAATSQSLTPNSATNFWPLNSWSDTKPSQAEIEIDLMHG